MADLLGCETAVLSTFKAEFLILKTAALSRLTFPACFSIHLVTSLHLQISHHYWLPSLWVCGRTSCSSPVCVCVSGDLTQHLVCYSNQPCPLASLASCCVCKEPAYTWGERGGFWDCNGVQTGLEALPGANQELIGRSMVHELSHSSLTLCMGMWKRQVRTEPQRRTKPVFVSPVK